MNLSKILLLYLEEKQVGILYHFTTLNNLINIANENFMLKASTRNNYPENFKKFVSFTRDKNLFTPGENETLVRIVIDGSKLSNNYKIVPYSDLHWKNKLSHRERNLSQSEEIITKEEVKIFNCIKSIDILGSKPSDEVLKKIQALKRNISINIIK